MVNNYNEREIFMNNFIMANPIIRIINEKANLRKNDASFEMNIYSLYLMKRSNYKMLKKKRMMIPT